MKIGFEQVDITPVTPVELAGFGYYMNRVATEVDAPLMGGILTLEDKDGSQAALCGLDIHSVNTETVAAIQDRLASHYGDRPAPTVALNGSHTHSGPATRQLYGAGGYNPEYVDQILIPRLSDTIIRSFDNATDGEISLARGQLEGIGYNRTHDGEPIDERLTVIKFDTERLSLAGLHFACHPIAFGKQSKVVAGDFPVYARAALKDVSNLPSFWLTGFAGDIDPISNKDSDSEEGRRNAQSIGAEIGHRAAALLDSARTVQADSVKGRQFTIGLPVATDFRLDPKRETEQFRLARNIPKTADLGPVQRWLKEVAPIVNAYPNELLAVPAVVINVGNIAFTGFGAEIYSRTGLQLEDDRPDLHLVNTMTTNEEEGYVPPASEYDRGAYSATNSAFIFGRKPLTRDSEVRFRQQVNYWLEDIVK